MLNIPKLLNNVAAQLSEKYDGEIRFTNLELKKAYSQLNWKNPHVNNAISA